MVAGAGNVLVTPACAATQVEVYTFGCPRVGNSSFAEAYNELVPETWHVINDRDTVGGAQTGD
jgi:predicted lipase